MLQLYIFARTIEIFKMFIKWNWKKCQGHLNKSWEAFVYPQAMAWPPLIYRDPLLVNTVQVSPPNFYNSGQKRCLKETFLTKTNSLKPKKLAMLLIFWLSLWVIFLTNDVIEKENNYSLWCLRLWLDSKKLFEFYSELNKSSEQ